MSIAEQLRLEMMKAIENKAKDDYRSIWLYQEDRADYNEELYRLQEEAWSELREMSFDDALSFIINWSDDNV